MLATVLPMAFVSLAFLHLCVMYDIANKSLELSFVDQCQQAHNTNSERTDYRNEQGNLALRGSVPTDCRHRKTKTECPGQPGNDKHSDIKGQSITGAQKRSTARSLLDSDMHAWLQSMVQPVRIPVSNAHLTVSHAPNGSSE